MLDRLMRWFKRDAPAPGAAMPSAAPLPLHKVGRLHAKPDPHGAPGERVYHEYFVEDTARADGWHWMCRVYAQNGAATKREGVAATHRQACEDAISWADATKAGLRGAA